MNSPTLLTREEIDNEPAGPRLDRWVAEVVMGMRVVRRRCTSGDGWVYEMTAPDGEAGPSFLGPDEPWESCPAYSRKIEAAMELAGTSPYNIELRRMQHPSGGWRWMAHLRFSAVTGEASCDSLPLAICRAALRSKREV